MTYLFGFNQNWFESSSFFRLFHSNLHLTFVSVFQWFFWTANFILTSSPSFVKCLWRLWKAIYKINVLLLILSLQVQLPQLNPSTSMYYTLYHLIIWLYYSSLAVLTGPLTERGLLLWNSAQLSHLNSRSRLQLEISWIICDLCVFLPSWNQIRKDWKKKEKEEDKNVRKTLTSAPFWGRSSGDKVIHSYSS